MKKNILLLLILCSVLKGKAQEVYTPPSNFRVPAQNARSPIAPYRSYDSMPKVYLGFGLGINNFAGIIGLGAEFRIYKPILLRAGIGLEPGGKKLSVGLLYDENVSNGWVLGITYVYSTGVSTFYDQLQVDSAYTTTSKQVTLELQPAATLNLTLLRKWVLHKHNEFFLEFGYAVPLQSNPYKVENEVILSDISKAAVNLISPGGIVLDCGLMFGLSSAR